MKRVSENHGWDLRRGSGTATETVTPTARGAGHRCVDMGAYAADSSHSGGLGVRRQAERQQPYDHDPAMLQQRQWP